MGKESVMKYRCSNCKLEFDAEDVLNCPRCSSKNISRVFEKKIVQLEKKEEKKFISPAVIREGKEGWKSFHSQEVRVCSKCGGKDFDLDWRHKEKTCKKCGEIYSLPRRWV